MLAELSAICFTSTIAMHLPKNCIWQVFELPPSVEQGPRLAASRGETRLCFTGKWEEAEGAER
jgi:hypothetical protein